MDISNPNLKFNGKFTVRKKTERIIIHHSATPGDVSAATIHGWHLGNGWMGIGYHFLVRTFGMVEIGRPEWAIGSHSGAAGNSNGIGICVAGNFLNARPTDKQIQVLVELIRDIYTRHGILPIIGHRDVMATACPGAMFPMDELRKAVMTNSMPYPPVNIQVAGQVIQSMIIEGKTMAPIRQTLDALRIPFSWDASTNSAVIGPYKLPAVIINGTGYLPIRELAGAIDRGVGWDANTRTATII